MRRTLLKFSEFMQLSNCSICWSFFQPKGAIALLCLCLMSCELTNENNRVNAFAEDILLSESLANCKVSFHTTS